MFNGQITNQNEHYKKAKLVLIALLYSLSLYFLFNEQRQLRKQKLEYFKSIWNYMDIALPVLIIVLVTFHVKELRVIEEQGEYKIPSEVYSVHSVCSLLMWVKFLYFLRIFQSTGYLIRMLFHVIWEMRIFLFILLLVYLGFGEAFLRLSETSDSPFIEDYAYSVVYAFRLSIGDTDTEAFEANR